MIKQLVLTALLACSEPSALAALGQPFESKAFTAGADANSAKRLMSGMRLALPGYDVAKVQLSSGTWVHEYIGSDGVVFAVKWSGPVLPDLQGLLGAYFGSFKRPLQASTSRAAPGSPLVVETSAVVIHSSGRMRAFRGYAYLPERVPKNLVIADVLR